MRIDAREKDKTGQVRTVIFPTDLPPEEESDRLHQMHITSHGACSHPAGHHLAYTCRHTSLTLPCHDLLTCKPLWRTTPPHGGGGLPDLAKKCRGAVYECNVRGTACWYAPCDAGWHRVSYSQAVPPLYSFTPGTHHGIPPPAHTLLSNMLCCMLREWKAWESFLHTF